MLGCSSCLCHLPCAIRAENPKNRVFSWDKEHTPNLEHGTLQTQISASVADFISQPGMSFSYMVGSSLGILLLCPSTGHGQFEMHPTPPHQPLYIRTFLPTCWISIDSLTLDLCLLFWKIFLDPPKQCEWALAQAHSTFCRASLWKFITQSMPVSPARLRAFWGQGLSLHTQGHNLLVNPSWLDVWLDASQSLWLWWWGLRQFLY